MEYLSRRRRSAFGEMNGWLKLFFASASQKLTVGHPYRKTTVAVMSGKSKAALG
jgi:hypothetical protein